MIAMAEEEKKKGAKEKEEKKSVSIKGVGSDAYERMMKFARDSGKTLGEVTTEAYRTFLGTIEGVRNVSVNILEGAKSAMPKYVENMKKLEITQKDLQDIGHKVTFRNIDELTFVDVDNETFDKYVYMIINVKKLNIPSKLTKTKVLLKSNFVDSVTQD